MSKRGTSTGYMAGAMKTTKSTRTKPSFTITEKDLPAIKGWKVGGKYTLTMDVEMISSSKGPDYDMPSEVDRGKKEIHEGRFKIIGIDEQSDETQNEKA